MDPEIGQVYLVQGTPQRYKGGDPEARESWEPVGAPESKPFTFSDGARMALQGLTAEYGDEMLPGAEATAASRERIRQIREDHPIKAGLSEMAGALPWALVPGGQSAPARIGVGALIGSLFGSGTGEGGLRDRADEAAVGAVVGAAGAGTGEALGEVANVVARRTAGRGARVAGELQRRSLTRPIEEAMQEAQVSLNRARADFYGPLEKQFAQVTDPEIMQFVSSDLVQSYLPRGLRTNPRRPPSLQELQQLRAKLRRVDRDGLHEQLNELMTDQLPGLREADAAYRQAVQMRTSLVLGQKLWNKSAARDIQPALDALQSNPAAQQKLREGMVHETFRQLRTHNEEAGGVLKRFLDAGPEWQAVMRTMFPDDQSFQGFQQVLRRERRARAIAEAFGRYGSAAAKTGALAIIGGTAAGIGYGVSQASFEQGAATP